MSPFRSGAAAGLALLAACTTDGHEAHGPAGIPYVCEAGQPARVFHRGGGDPLRARARLLYDGRSIELRGAPTEAGLRYASEAEPNAAGVLVWTEQGEQARLSEVPVDEADFAAGREIARCTRLRSAEGEAGADGHGAPDHPL